MAPSWVVGLIGAVRLSAASTSSVTAVPIDRIAISVYLGRASAIEARSEHPVLVDRAAQPFFVVVVLACGRVLALRAPSGFSPPSGGGGGGGGSFGFSSAVASFLRCVLRFGCNRKSPTGFRHYLARQRRFNAFRNSARISSVSATIAPTVPTLMIFIFSSILDSGFGKAAASPSS